MRFVLRCIYIYVFPAFILVYTYVTDRTLITDYWYLYGVFLLSLVYAHIGWESSSKKGFSDRLRVRKFFFAYFFMASVGLIPELGLTGLANAGSNKFGLDKSVFLILLIFTGAVLYYIFVISDFDITEISIGNTKMSVIKDKIEKEIDNQFGLYDSFVEKIKAEHQIIQNMGDYCEAIRIRVNETDSFDIADEFRRILMEYVRLQSENYGIGVISSLDDRIRADYGLKTSEFGSLACKMSDNGCFLHEKGSYFLFFPYSFETATLYIVIESKMQILHEERYLILNILKVLEENVLAMFYIESMAES